MKLEVRVTPRARKEEVLGYDAQGTLKVKVTAPPQDGRANQAVLELLADHLKVAKSAIKIVKGVSSRNKTLIIEETS